jgi:hypothetical protein
MPKKPEPSQGDNQDQAIDTPAVKRLLWRKRLGIKELELLIELGACSDADYDNLDNIPLSSNNKLTKTTP